MTHFLILLRNLQPKKVHGKPGQAVPLLPATKKIRARASASQHYIQAELLRELLALCHIYLSKLLPFCYTERVLSFVTEQKANGSGSQIHGPAVREFLGSADREDIL